MTFPYQSQGEFCEVDLHQYILVGRRILTAHWLKGAEIMKVALWIVGIIAGALLLSYLSGYPEEGSLSGGTIFIIGLLCFVAYGVGRGR